MEEQIKKYIAKELSKEEGKELLEKIYKNPRLIQLYAKLKAISTVELIKESANKEINEKEFNQLQSKLFKHELRMPLVAVAIIVLLFIGSNFYKMIVATSTTISTGNSLTKTVILPDNSTITLKENSTISFSDFSKKREVTLLGEAFFDVEKDNSKPFTVHVNNVLVRVLGTTFNIEAYDNQDFVKTILFTGKVDLETLEGKKEKLIPNQEAIYNKKDNTIHINDIENVLSATYYKNNWLVFKDASLEEVKKELERRYSKTIKLALTQQNNYKFTGKFDTKTSLTEVLEILEVTTPVVCEVKQDIIIIKNKK